MRTSSDAAWTVATCILVPFSTLRLLSQRLSGSLILAHSQTKPTKDSYESSLSLMGYLSALITLSPSEKVARTSNWVTSFTIRNAAGKEFEMDFGMLAKPSWFSHTSSLKTATTASATPALSSDPALRSGHIPILSAWRTVRGRNWQSRPVTRRHDFPSDGKPASDSSSSETTV